MGEPSNFDENRVVSDGWRYHRDTNECCCIHYTSDVLTSQVGRTIQSDHVCWKEEDVCFKTFFDLGSWTYWPSNFGKNCVYFEGWRYHRYNIECCCIQSTSDAITSQLARAIPSDHVCWKEEDVCFKTDFKPILEVSAFSNFAISTFGRFWKSPVSQTSAVGSSGRWNISWVWVSLLKGVWCRRSIEIGFWLWNVVSTFVYTRLATTGSRRIWIDVQALQKQRWVAGYALPCIIAEVADHPPSQAPHRSTTPV